MTQTIENLTKAFIGESMARNRYTFYASTAREEGYEQIAAIFQLTADNENEHAEWLMKMINQLKAKSTDDYGEIHVEAAAPTVWGTTVENLKAAIAGETYEYTTMYPEFARVAKAEGYKDIAGRLLSIANAEEHHGGRYARILKEVEAGTFFKKPQEVAWVCRKCGYVHFGREPPAKCPSCDHEKSYYELLNEVY
ncbi:rubrerythrin [Methanocella paludicola SANAE]|uniref:Rubrerythrin n=1 Tax=Methanocella paludicola (strain DSM 17711 / JCM 13418 / NBRC 101707 / SANAE) TaxID=304371 RepID=D1YVC8_METPS|nr:rubrerythrin family protein [Methanocella paludicola]BAI60400.1 rubrerythrin [Methanocella paludicola SANAE]